MKDAVINMTHDIGANRVKHFFELRLGALIPWSVGRSVGRSVCLSVCLSVLKYYEKMTTPSRKLRHTAEASLMVIPNVLKGFVKFCNFFVIFGEQTDRPTDRPTDRQTDRPRY